MHSSKESIASLSETLETYKTNLQAKCTVQKTFFTMGDNTSDTTKTSIVDRKQCSLDAVISEDTFPDINNYRNQISISGPSKHRPTLFELQNIDTQPGRLGSKRNSTNENFNTIVCTNDVKNSQENLENNIVKFGWIQGVLVRCILNIFGVMIFLRLSWVVGNAGIGLATVIILIATMVTSITALSASAICTNGEVKGGGAYYLISRSLGPEFGGAIGIVFSFANAVAVAMYTVGFAETVTELMKRHSLRIVDNSTNDVRIIGIVTLVVLLAIALIGMSWESKVQVGLLMILIVSFFNFLIGSVMSPSVEKQSKGFLGYKVSLFLENFKPNYAGKEDFAHVFGVFFPAVTGILAGANISGNLKNPQKAIPKGTLLSVVITSTIYLVFSWICGATMLRVAHGNNFNLSNSSANDCVSRKCEYGLLYNYQTMEMVSAYGPIITAGIFSASLSSALASLISAPKIFQAVCADRIFPKLECFSIGYGKNKEPFRAYLLTFLIAAGCVLIGDLNSIAPIISNFFLMSYALINYSCFDASIAKTPGWRPAFKYYNKWISLFGALLCIFVMFIIKWWAALVTFLVIIGIYLYVRQVKPDINWGSSTQAHIYRCSLEYSLKLMSIQEHVKNFRPQCLVLSGVPMQRPALCDFVASTTKSTSLMVCGNVILNNNDSNQMHVSDVYEWFRKRKIKGFYTEISTQTFREGCLALMQCVGLGKLKPNTVVIGFKNDWKETSVESTLEYFQVINDAFNLQYGVCILRVPGGLKYSNYLSDDFNEINISTNTSDDFDIISTEIDMEKMTNISTITNSRFFGFLLGKSSKTSENHDQNETTKSRIRQYEKKDLDSKFNTIKSCSLISMKTLNKAEIRQMTCQSTNHETPNIFYHKYKKNFIDVWWLYDDGGLTILIPYLISQRKYWHDSKLRIFIQTKKSTNDTANEERNMAALLKKFRIKFEQIVVLSTFHKKPSAENCLLYEKFIDKCCLKADETSEKYPWKITDVLIEQNQEKINHYIRLKELLLQYSTESNLIVVTITVPSILTTSACLYMSWLDFISDGMPPVLMMRGNQAPVLTYYS